MTRLVLALSAFLAFGPVIPEPNLGPPSPVYDEGDLLTDFVAELRTQGIEVEVPACAAAGDGATCYGRAVGPGPILVVGTVVAAGGPWTFERFLPPVPVTVAELDAALGPAASAWIARPSGPSYDALAAAAAGVLATGRPLGPELIDDPAGAAGDPASVLGGLATYPGSDAMVAGYLEVLTLPSLGATTPSVPIQPSADLPPTPGPAPAPATDRLFDTCREAIANGYGPYERGVDPEYSHYDDRDNDGIVCER